MGSLERFIYLSLAVLGILIVLGALAVKLTY